MVKGSRTTVLSNSHQSVKSKSCPTCELGVKLNNIKKHVIIFHPLQQNIIFSKSHHQIIKVHIFPTTRKKIIENCCCKLLISLHYFTVPKLIS